MIRSFNYKGRFPERRRRSVRWRRTRRRRSPVRPPRSPGCGLFHVKHWLRRHPRSLAIRRLSRSRSALSCRRSPTPTTTSLRAGARGMSRALANTEAAVARRGGVGMTVTAPYDTPARMHHGPSPLPGASPAIGTTQLPVAACRSVAPGTYAPSNLDISTGIIKNESGGNLNVRDSPQGAVGPGQILPATAKPYTLPGEDLRNPADNLAIHHRIIADYQRRWRTIPRASRSPISPVPATSRRQARRRRGSVTSATSTRACRNTSPTPWLERADPQRRFRLAERRLLRLPDQTIQASRSRTATSAMRSRLSPSPGATRAKARLATWVTNASTGRPRLHRAAEVVAQPCPRCYRPSRLTSPRQGSS